MEFFGNIIAHLKDMKLILALSIIMVISALLQRYLEFDFTLAAGLAMLCVSLPVVIYQAIKKRKETYDLSKYKETIKRGQEALDRSNKVLSKDAKFCPSCDRRMVIMHTLPGGAIFNCPKCRIPIPYEF